MFGSEILEVAIGLMLVYLLLSLMCSVLSEWYARMLGMRSNTLEKTIQNLFADPAADSKANTKADPEPTSVIAEQIYKHPLIKSLAHKGWWEKLLKKDGKPSYITPHTFALVVMDIIADDGLAVRSQNIEVIRQAITDSKLGKEGSQWKKALLTLVNSAQDDADKARKNIEDWFDDAMVRLTGSYKRKNQTIVLIIAIGISLFLNADTFTIANSLWRDNTLRASVVAAAQETVKQPLPNTSNASLTKIVELQAELNQLNLPFGWVKPSDKYKDQREIPGFDWGLPYKIMGLLATAVALSLGAPFWFDTLNKFVNLRGAGKPAAEKEAVPKNKPPET